jgi:membrane protein required for colicin V production
VNVDLAVVALLVLFAVMGALSGALRQLVMLASALLGYLAARYLAPPLAAGFTRGSAQPVARAIAGVLVFFAVLFVASFLGHALVARAGGGQAVRGPTDRGLGALLGAAKGAMGLWVVLSAFVLVGRPVGPSFFRLDPRDSDFAAVAGDFNVLDTWASPTAATLRRLLRALRDPRASSRLTRDEDIRALLEDPRLQQLLARSQAGAQEAGRAVTTPEALRLLSDPAFLDRLQKAQRKLDHLE